MATPEEMDKAAPGAEKAFKELPKECIEKIGAWWNEFYKPVGHKRLGRILVKYFREPELLKEE